jgi:hypothetical protein
MLFFGIVVLYDASMSYQYGKIMRELLSFHQPGFFDYTTSPYPTLLGLNQGNQDDDHDAKHQVLRPYSRPIGSTDRPFSNQDESENNDDKGSADERKKPGMLLRPSRRADGTPGRAITILSVPSHTIPKHNPAAAHDTNLRGTFDRETNDDDDDDTNGRNDDHELDDEPWILVAKKHIHEDPEAQEKNGHTQDRRRSCISKYDSRKCPSFVVSKLPRVYTTIETIPIR